MTTLAEAEAALHTALQAAGIRTGAVEGVDPPGAIIYGDGIDVAHLTRGEVEASFRITFVGGAWDGAASRAALAGVIALALPAFAGLAGWRVGAITPDSTVRIAGNILLGADAVVSHMVTI